MRNYLYFLIFAIILPTSLLAQSQIGPDISGWQENQRFGNYVCISSDGKVIAVKGGSSAEFRIYQEVSEVWSLYGVDESGGNFDGVLASSIALSGDGNTFAYDDESSTYVYKYNNGIWQLKGSPINHESAGSTELDLSYDGNNIAVGIPCFNSVDSTGRVSGYGPPPLCIGIVRVFSFNSENWIQRGDNLLGDTNLSDGFGQDLEFSDDGDILGIASNTEVKVFSFNSNNWSLMGSSMSANIESGTKLSISSEGSSVAIGEWGFSDVFFQQGRTIVYRYSENDWVQEGNIIYGSNNYSFLGEDVSLSASGNTLAIGSAGYSENDNHGNEVKIFQIVEGIWTERGSAITGENSSQYSGVSVDLSDDASRIIIGSPDYDSGVVDIGRVRIFDLSAIIDEPSLGLNEYDLENIKIYPNPASALIKIHLPDGVLIKELRIVNLIGQQILISQSASIDVSFLSTGTYFMDVTTNQGKTNRKLIINR